MIAMRSRIIPKIFSEILALGFVLFIIPAIYIFELSVVLPSIFDGHKPYDKFWLYFHSLCGSFVMFNIVGNLLGVILVDTSTKHILVDSSKALKADGWHLCSVCETISPPRSWHCTICNTCILKREHHCIFTGCCVGFTNFRFFYLFLAYLFAATIYASYFNHYFIWTSVMEFQWSHIIRIVMPLTLLFFGIDTSYTQLYFFYYSVTLIGCCFSGMMLLQQSYFLFYNQTSYEKNKQLSSFNLKLMENMKDALGLKWYLTWVCPFLKSPLPHNGTAWKKVVTQESNKNK